MNLKEIVNRIIFGKRASSETYIRYLRNKGMRIGDRTKIFGSKTVQIDEQKPWLIEIGDDVQITKGVTILTHGYDWSVLKKCYGEVLGSAGKVTIGNNVFIGMNSIILKGVTIGNNTIIGAGSVVTHSIPSNCVAAGNPAKPIMSIEDYHKKRCEAQYEEASELVRNYRIVYGKDPDEEALSEFFWLFCNDNENLPECWEIKMGLVGNREESGKAFETHSTMFDGMEEFLKSVK